MTVMEMEMEMRAIEEIKEGEDVTPPLIPLTFALRDSLIDTHCYSCFYPLPCCCSSFPLSSPELLLLRSSTDSSDLRAALCLLQSLPTSTCNPPPPRLFGLLTNRDKLISSSDFDVTYKIRQGAMEMAKARGSLSGDFAWEEAALCLVLTNAVEVQDYQSGRVLGIAVYDKDFSWINHSCSPNACYRFLLSVPDTLTFSQEPMKMRIAPHIDFNTTEAKNLGNANVCISSELKQGTTGYGPRITVRSIKRITKGQEVTIAYMDLLQPKGMRQSELWSKYQFACYCRRCAASPPNYVDVVLEEIHFSDPEFSGLISDYNFHKDEANKKVTEWMDEVISEYLSAGGPESCSKKLESMLTRGLHGGKLQLAFRLHPLHHHALNAYTTLASAYKIRSIDLLALHSDIGGHHREALDMSRISAGYSLLLACGTDHLFRSESSLIASAANFWASAGESLLTLARSSEWNVFVKPALPLCSSLEKHKCSNCSLMNRFQVNPFLIQAGNSEFHNISGEFLACISSMTRKVWGFLGHGCLYLEIFQDPIDFTWLGKSPKVGNFQANFRCKAEESDDKTEHEERICRRAIQPYKAEERIMIFQIGVHCLVYGGYLANMCYGQHSHLSCQIKDILTK